jgi:hypothetical protein
LLFKIELFKEHFKYTDQDDKKVKDREPVPKVSKQTHSEHFDYHFKQENEEEDRVQIFSPFVNL